mmetsp:Transcript_16131/g.54051  ORF Transcript_16131/g.54051 Transcript_16131/m.54051 type:complete len:92 (-) Transcript_16131:2541-2816(-)
MAAAAAAAVEMLAAAAASVVASAFVDEMTVPAAVPVPEPVAARTCSVVTVSAAGLVAGTAAADSVLALAARPAMKQLQLTDARSWQTDSEP